jgi:hypothetical protein
MPDDTIPQKVSMFSGLLVPVDYADMSEINPAADAIDSVRC